MGILKTDQSQDATKEDEILCDLDQILSRRVVFKLFGKTHALLPITTEVFFEFWDEVKNFRQAAIRDSNGMNKAYFTTLRSVCSSISQKDVDRMTVVQKANLLEHISAKITGIVAAGPEKKNFLTQSQSKSALPN